MNIGSFARNATGHIVGKVSTLTVDLNIGLKPIRSDNPNAPKFEILALSAARQALIRGPGASPGLARQCSSTASRSS